MKFEYRVKKIEHDARKAAVFSGDNHHKFLMGHMIVFRMHLNKVGIALKLYFLLLSKLYILLL